MGSEPYDDLSLILDAYRTRPPWGDREPTEMETLAFASYTPPSYKHVVVNMRGVNGNTLVIVGTVKLALKRAGASPLDISMFVAEALSHDYEHALATVCQWVTVTDEDPKPKHDAWEAMLRIAGQEDERDL